MWSMLANSDADMSYADVSYYTNNPAILIINTSESEVLSAKRHTETKDAQLNLINIFRSDIHSYSDTVKTAGDRED